MQRSCLYVLEAADILRKPRMLYADIWPHVAMASSSAWRRHRPNCPLSSDDDDSNHIITRSSGENREIVLFIQFVFYTYTKVVQFNFCKFLSWDSRGTLEWLVYTEEKKLERRSSPRHPVFTPPRAPNGPFHACSANLSNEQLA